LPFERERRTERGGVADRQPPHLVRLDAGEHLVEPEVLLHRTQPGLVDLVEDHVVRVALAHEHAAHRLGADLALAGVTTDQQFGHDVALRRVRGADDERLLLVEPKLRQLLRRRVGLDQHVAVGADAAQVLEHLLLQLVLADRRAG
jgi:hypothetical protein